VQRAGKIYFTTVHTGAKMSGKKEFWRGKNTIGASGPNVLKTNVIKYKIKYRLLHKHVNSFQYDCLQFFAYLRNKQVTLIVSKINSKTPSSFKVLSVLFCDHLDDNFLLLLLHRAFRWFKYFHTPTYALVAYIIKILYLFNSSYMFRHLMCHHQGALVLLAKITR
jgi:hypothetical protein